MGGRESAYEHGGADARPHTNRTGANFVGWGIMQSATEGPWLSSNGYHLHKWGNRLFGKSLHGPLREVDRHTANPLNLRFDRRGFFPSTSSRPLNEQR